MDYSSCGIDQDGLLLEGDRECPFPLPSVLSPCMVFSKFYTPSCVVLRLGVGLDWDGAEERQENIHRDNRNKTEKRDDS